MFFPLRKVCGRKIRQSTPVSQHQPHVDEMCQVKGTSKNPHFIPTAALRKKFLLTYYTDAELRNFSRALYLGEI